MNIKSKAMFIISVHHKCSLDAFISPYFSWYSTDFNPTLNLSSSEPILNDHKDISHVHHFCSSAMFISHVHLSTEVSQNVKDFNQTWNLSFSNPILNEHKFKSHVHKLCSSQMFIGSVHQSIYQPILNKFKPN